MLLSTAKHALMGEQGISTVESKSNALEQLDVTDIRIFRCGIFKLVKIARYKDRIAHLAEK